MLPVYNNIAVVWYPGGMGPEAVAEEVGRVLDSSRVNGHLSELDGWSNAIVAAAMKILWEVPGNSGDLEVQRRLARAEALRNGRAYERSTHPVPDVSPTIPFTSSLPNQG